MSSAFIKCNAESCRHNGEGKCTLTSICIEECCSCTHKKKDRTCCGSYEQL